MRWVAGIPTLVPWKGKAALQSTSVKEADWPAALSHTPTPIQEQAFPRTISLHSDRLTFMGAAGCTEGFSWQTRTARDLISTNCFAGLSVLLRHASRQTAYLNLFFNLSYNYMQSVKTALTFNKMFKKIMHGYKMAWFYVNKLHTLAFKNHNYYLHNSIILRALLRKRSYIFSNVTVLFW